MDKSTTCARHPDGTASELWRSLSYQVGDEHANRICSCIDLYCRVMNLPVERLRSHVPGASPVGPTPQKVVSPGFQPVAQALEELRMVVAAVGGHFVKDTQPCTSSLLATLRERFTALEDAIDARIATERRERVILSLSGAGKVREYQLKLTVQYQVTDNSGKVTIPTSEIQLQRILTYDDSQIIAKQQEEAQLFQDMEKDAAAQILRRMTAIRR